MSLLDHNLDRLKEAGVSRAIVNVHYLPDHIIAHVAKRTMPRVTISDERAELLDSGGGIANVIAAFGDAPFFSLNADTIWLDGPKSNLVRLAEHFDEDRMDALLMLAPAATTIGWGNRGDFFQDQNGRLTRPDKIRVAPFAYTGVAVLKPSLFAGRPRIFSLNTIFNEAIEKERLFGLRLDGFFMHVGDPDALRDAEQALRLLAL